MTKVPVILLCFLMAGCSLVKVPGSIKLPVGLHDSPATVVGVQNAGQPATLASNEEVATLTLPKGTIVTTALERASVGIPATPSNPGIPPTPQKETISFVLPEESKWVKTNTTLSANTGTVDTSIATHKIDVQAAQPLLYAAILSGVAAGFFVYRAYPTPALICGGASVVFLIAWKAAEAPPWLWAVGACGIAGAVALYIGHNRGESDAKTLESPK